MEEIEKVLEKKIIRIETNDLDEMEEVSSPCFLLLPVGSAGPIENEEGVEVVYGWR